MRRSSMLLFHPPTSTRTWTRPPVSRWVPSAAAQQCDGSHGWKRAPARIVERSHPDCRKPVRCSFRFNRVTGNQDRHCSVCVGRGVLPFHPPGYMAQGPPSRASSIPVFVEPCLVLRTSRNDDDVARAADPLFAPEAELHLALRGFVLLRDCAARHGPRPRYSTIRPSLGRPRECDG